LGDDEDRTLRRTGAGGGWPTPMKIEATRIAYVGREKRKREERKEEEATRRFK
jgi:hypothetical protein